MAADRPPAPPSQSWVAAEALRRQGALQAAQAAFRGLIQGVLTRRLARQAAQLSPLLAQKAHLRRQLTIAGAALALSALALGIYFGWPQPRYAKITLAQPVIDWLARNELYYLMTAVHDPKDIRPDPQAEQPDRKGSGSGFVPQYLLPPGAVAQEKDALLGYMQIRFGEDPTAVAGGGVPTGSAPTIVPAPGPLKAPSQRTAKLVPGQKPPPGYSFSPFHCLTAPVACPDRHLPAGPRAYRPQLWAAWEAVWVSTAGDCAQQASMLEQIGQVVHFRGDEAVIKAALENSVARCFLAERRWGAAEEFARRALCTAWQESLDAYQVLAASAAGRGAAGEAQRCSRCAVEYSQWFASRYIPRTAPFQNRSMGVGYFTDAAASIWEYGHLYDEAIALWERSEAMALSMRPATAQQEAELNQRTSVIQENFLEAFLYKKDAAAFAAARRKLEANPAHEPPARIVAAGLDVMLCMRLGRWNEAAQRLEALVAQYQLIEEYNQVWMLSGTRAWLAQEAAEHPDLRTVNKQIEQLTYALEGNRTPEKVALLMEVGLWLRKH